MSRALLLLLAAPLVHAYIPSLLMPLRSLHVPCNSLAASVNRPVRGVALGGCFYAPQFRPVRPLCMGVGVGTSDGSTMADAEVALDEAISCSDIDGISKSLKRIAKLQVAKDGAAGGTPYTAKKITKEDEAAAIQELLGKLDNNAADDVADALTQNALEEMAFELQVAEAALGWALDENDSTGRQFQKPDCNTMYYITRLGADF